MRRVLLIALVLFSINAQAQLDWWNQTHNWDGTTPWTQYMKYSHAYLGPNAIPIPTLQRPITPLDMFWHMYLGGLSISKSISLPQ